MGYLEPKAGVFPSLIISRSVWHWRQHVYLFNTCVIPVENSMKSHFISLRCSTLPFSLISFPPFTLVCITVTRQLRPPHVESTWRYMWTSEHQLRYATSPLYPRHLWAQANPQACVACLWCVYMRPVLQQSQTEPSVLVTAVCVGWIGGTRIVVFRFIWRLTGK